MTHHYFLCTAFDFQNIRLYNVFGSGANHGIYAQFMAQSALANKGNKVAFAEVLVPEWLYGSMP